MISDDEHFVDAVESLPEYCNVEDTEKDNNEFIDAVTDQSDKFKISSKERELQEEKLSVVEIEDSGNDVFRDSKFTEALEKYTEALDLCPLKCAVERSVMFSNRAACHIKLDSSEAALADCNASIELQPDYVRCLSRRASLLEEKQRLTDAYEDYKRLLQLEPSNEKFRYACMSMPERIKIQNEKMKEEMLGQLKQLGNMVLKPFGLSTDNFKVQKNPDTEGYSINFAR